TGTIIHYPKLCINLSKFNPGTAMPSRSSRWNKSDDADLARVVLLFMLSVGPAAIAWFKPRPWAFAVGAVAFGVGLAGICGLVITTQRVRREAQQRALKT